MIRDVLGDRGTEELLSALQPIVEKLQTLGWKEMRPWSEFFATFKPPQLDPKHLEQRVTTNFLHYRSNYFAISIGVLVLQILTSPIIIISSFTIFALCTYILQVHKKPFIVGDFSFDGVGKQYLCAGLSLFILLVTGTVAKLLFCFLYIIILCGGHMVFRPRSVSSKANRMYEEMKLSGYNVFNVPSFDSKVSESKGSRDDPEEPPMYDDGKYADRDLRYRGSSKYN